MRTKQEIVENWLPRYTHRRLEDFGEYILLTNFNNYVELFAEECNSDISSSSVKNGLHYLSTLSLNIGNAKQNLFIAKFFTSYHFFYITSLSASCNLYFAIS